MAGGLAAFVIVDRNGAATPCSDVDYKGQRTGYTADPQEIINYVEAHDNETLFDALQYKLPVGTSLQDRARVQNLGLSLIAFSQGVPFFHAGGELLRSKSGDRSSYNSGDWFNRIDFTYRSNNWGVGLPPAGDNQGNWPILQPLPANPALRPGSPEILGTFEHMLEVLAIRRSMPLLRLRTAEEIQGRVTFLNGGPNAIPGLIAMVIRDPSGDLKHDLAAVLVTAAPGRQLLTAPELAGAHLMLHPVHRSSPDAVSRTATFDRATGTFSIPGRTAVVFVAARARHAR